MEEWRERRGRGGGGEEEGKEEGEGRGGLWEEEGIVNRERGSVVFLSPAFFFSFFTTLLFLIFFFFFVWCVKVSKRDIPAKEAVAVTSIERHRGGTKKI